MQGFSLIEIMMALAILTFGLLAAGQLIYVSLGSGSLARSKGTAAITAQNKLEYLSDLYRRNPNAPDLALGTHGPQQIQVLNPIDGTILNNYNVAWTLANVVDPRPDKALDARLVSVTITPIQSDGSVNMRPFLNKAVTVTTIFSLKTQ
jgi:prepilin-type N-terminal cleavage/methylation domain-containing protein